MKSILASALLIALMGFSPRPATTIYYFYYSRAISTEDLVAMKTLPPSSLSNAGTTDQKSVVMFTTLREGSLSENEIKGLAQTWGRWVNENCVSLHGCTSDLNYYPTKEQAEKALISFRKKYSDGSKYLVSDVDF